MGLEVKHWRKAEGVGPNVTCSQTHCISSSVASWAYCAGDENLNHLKCFWRYWEQDGQRSLQAHWWHGAWQCSCIMNRSRRGCQLHHGYNPVLIPLFEMCQSCVSMYYRVLSRGGWSFLQGSCRKGFLLKSKFFPGKRKTLPGQLLLRFLELCFKYFPLKERKDFKVKSCL